jgi:outer membrane protein insertion porin family
MSFIGCRFASAFRIAAFFAALMVIGSFHSAQAQKRDLANAPNSAATAAAEPAGPPIRQIEVLGTQRIEPATVLSYISLHQGDLYSEQSVDSSLKTLFATGLFADVKFNWDGSKLTIRVVENPIINQVDFEGNNKVGEKELTKEVQLKPRMVFTRNKVQADVQRIIELYRRNGKFAATVDPQIIQRPQNRVDLIFSINEGPTTGVARISFIGNKVFDDDTLKEQIATEESAWYRILATNDNYDPDRLTFDREQLRRFYLSHGYADFEVVSAVAELTPDRRNFYITFTVNEGDLYKFGRVEIDSTIKELDPRSLRAAVPIRSGDIYDAELIQKSIDALTNAAGSKGYAFAEVHPRIRRDRDHHTIDVIFKIDQGARVYIEKINISGNSRTLDKVIRREFRLVEGDAFNRVLVDRSRTRIRALGYFKNVDVKPEAGSAPDRTVLNVKVEEQSTGQLSIGAGYSSTSSLVGEFSYTETNLFGRGQYLRGSVSVSSISKQFQISFTEPYFLDRPLAAGIDLYKVITDFQQADYQGDLTAAGVRLGFPTSEYGSVSLRYTYSIDRITPFSGAPNQVFEAEGTTQTSSLGYTYSYNTLDDPIKPNKGFTFSVSQELAGFGGTLKYLKSEGSFSFYRPLIWDSVVASLTGSAGYITGYDGQNVRISERFFKGGDSFRGFALAGIGPRDVAVGNNAGAVGGNVYAIGTFQVRVPNFLPDDYGISTSLFSDFGTLGRVDRLPTDVTVSPYNHQPCSTLKIGSGEAGTTCLADNLALRASAGVSVGWKSPFGPIQVDLGMPFLKAPYDRPEIIHFSAGTGF